MNNPIVPLSYRREGTIDVLTLNNPKVRNALSVDMIIALIERLQQSIDDPECRAMVITGAGGHFCAGGDVSAMTEDRAVLPSRQRIERAHRIIRLLACGPKPVVAAVEGYAFGAGLSLVAACDIVVSSSAAKYCAVFAKVGLIPDMGLMWTLPQRIGTGQARKLFFNARVVEGGEALHLGLADQLVEPGQALNAAMTVALELAAASPLAVAVTKAAYAKGSMTLEDVLRIEVETQPMLYQSQDHRNAVAAFRDKRSPEFKGT